MKNATTLGEPVIVAVSPPEYGTDPAGRWQNASANRSYKCGNRLLRGHPQGVRPNDAQHKVRADAGR